MDLKVISSTIQEYKGERYYLCGRYFQRNGRRLHVVVWSDQNGRKPPKGYHVHHKDEDRSNNQPGNLDLLKQGEHMSHHGKGHGRAPVDLALDEAAKWHASDAGREWHRQHHAAMAHKLYRQAEFTCEQCGTVFVTQVTGANRFCSNGCKTKHRFLSGVDDVERACVICGGAFTVNRYRKTRTCGPKCQGTLSGNTRRRS